MSTFLLVLVILVLAAVGGVLGTLLEVAAWLLGIMVLLGAVLGLVVWGAWTRLRTRASAGPTDR